MTYAVVLRPAAERELADLPRNVQARIHDCIAELRQDPRPHGCQRLQGPLREYLRLRVGDYRVIYTVDDSACTVRVARIGHRSTFYKRVEGL